MEKRDRRDRTTVLGGFDDRLRALRCRDPEAGPWIHDESERSLRTPLLDALSWIAVSKGGVSPADDAAEAVP
jgi:hypothetical protein